jgi:putative hydrolase of the HAD superfamily
MPTLTTILFDAGGTLVRPNFQRMADEFAADGVVTDATVLARADREMRLGLEQPGLEARVRAGDPWRHYMQELTRCAAIDGVPDGACERLRRYHDAENLWEDLMPGTIEALEQLAPHYRMGVVSNANGTVRALMARIGLGRFFEVVVDSQEEGVSKPDARLFRIGLERMRASAETTAYIGDIYAIDVLGARGAGLHPVLLDPHGLHADKPCDRITTLLELPALLSRFGDRAPHGADAIR